MSKNPLCVPRFRKTSRANSLLDRLREAVFRLIMLSAFSKGATKHYSHDICQSSEHRYYVNNNDQQHSEAVADCIEFIKRSATGSRKSGASRNYSSDSSASQVVVPLPIM